MNTERTCTSRRQFLQRGLFALTGLLSFDRDFLARIPVTQAGKHPSLFFSQDDLPRIRENARLSNFKEFWNSLVNADLAADKKFLVEELDIHNHVAHLLRANEILKRSAFVALIDENRQHEELATLTIEKILSFNEWDYFLEGGTETIGLQRAPETTLAMSFAYDWLYERISSSTRSAILDAIAKKGCPPCYLTLYGMKYPDRVKGWGFNPTSTYKLRFDLSRWPIILDKTNLKMIPIAGLTIGSVLLYDHHPDAPKWLDLARESLENFASLYGKDGSYLEGISYWYYTTQHYAMAIDVLKRLRGVDLRKLINFRGTMRFALQMGMPSRNYPDDVVNFSDAAASPDASVGFWVAREFKDGLAQHTAELYGAKRNLFALIWNEPSVKASLPSVDLKDVKFEDDWIVSRSGWGVDDTVVGMRSGGPANHEHADRNSVIVKAYGERLLHDPYGAAYSYTEKHWILRLTEAHTAVLVDGKGHQYHDGREGTNPSKAQAHVVQYNPGEKLSVFTSDATPAYRLVNEDVRKVQRTIVFVKPDVVLFIDEFEKENSPSTFQVRFQAFNVDGLANLVIGIDGQSFEIRRPFALLSAKVAGDCPVQVAQGKLDVPEDKGIFPYIEVATQPSKTATLVVACHVRPVGEVAAPRLDVRLKGAVCNVIFKTSKNDGALVIRLERDFPRVKFES